MKTRVLVLSTIVLGVGLAGCLGNDEPTTPADAAIERPEHSPGQFWTYAMDGSLATIPGIPLDAGNGFTVISMANPSATSDLKTDSCEAEKHKDHIEVLSTKPLDGQRGQRNLLDWPLEEGKTWRSGSKNWRFEFRVDEITEDGIARISSTNNDGELVYEYEYDPHVGWFKHLRDHRLERIFTLEDHGKSFEGEICTLTETPIMQHELQDGLHTETVDVPAEGHTLMLYGPYEASVFLAGAWLAHIEYKTPRSPDYETLYEDFNHCLISCHARGSLGGYFAAEPGQWGWRFTSWSYSSTLELTHLVFHKEAWTVP